MDIYLAILEDRHIDIQIELFQDIVHAQKQIRQWQYNYIDEDWLNEDIEGWEYYVRSSSEDGPNMRIEKKILCYYSDHYNLNIESKEKN